MEVVHKKQLHHHVIPIVLLSTVVLLLSLVMTFKIAYSSLSLNDLVTEKWYAFSPTKNGLFEMHSARAEISQQPTIGNIGDTGKTAQLQASFTK